MWQPKSEIRFHVNWITAAKKSKLILNRNEYICIDLVPLSYFLCLRWNVNKRQQIKIGLILIENCNHAWVDKKIETGHVFVSWTL